MRLRAALLLAAVLAAKAAEPSDRQVFQEFLAWYQTYTGTFEPPVVLSAYQTSLRQNGATAAEIERRTGIVRKNVAGMPREFASVHFDRIYRMEKPPYKNIASQFLVRMVEDLRPGKALDVAMGQGRNAHFLASRGWDVTGYDISEGGLAAARSLAARAGLKLDIVLASHEEFEYGTSRWDLIVQTFAFTNLSDEAYRRRVIGSLKPGGLLLIEGFSGLKAPKNAMFEGFKDLRIVYFEDRDDIADWGMQKARLLRLAAQKE